MFPDGTSEEAILGHFCHLTAVSFGPNETQALIHSSIHFLLLLPYPLPGVARGVEQQQAATHAHVHTSSHTSM